MELSLEVWYLAYKQSHMITDEEVSQTLLVIKSDPRVSFVASRGRTLGGRPLIEITAVNLHQGRLNGIYRIGEVLHTLFGNFADHRANLAEAAAHVESLIATTRKLQLWAETQTERAGNLARLWAAGICPHRLSSTRDRLTSGSVVDDEALKEWAWYEREIVRGRPMPTALHLYLLDFVPPASYSDRE